MQTPSSIAQPVSTAPAAWSGLATQWGLTESASEVLQGVQRGASCADPT
jgi:hypothetical protein